MSPVNVSFGFGTTTADSIIINNGQLALQTWQQSAIKADLAVLHDAFGITFNEVSPLSADVVFGAAAVDLSVYRSDAYGLVDRASPTSASHVWFAADHSGFDNPALFARVAAKEIAHALTATDNGPFYTTVDGMKPYPYPSDSLFSIEELVAVGSKFGTTFHLNAADQQVARLYLGEFGRMPDHAGLDVQLNAFHSGASLVALANAFLNTAEGVATFGTDRGATFVEHAYQAIFGRQAEQGGERVQVEALAHGLNPGQFIVNLVNSGEFLARIHDGLLFT